MSNFFDCDKFMQATETSEQCSLLPQIVRFLKVCAINYKMQRPKSGLSRVPAPTWFVKQINNVRITQICNKKRGGILRLSFICTKICTIFSFLPSLPHELSQALLRHEHIQLLSLCQLSHHQMVLQT